MSGIRVLLVAIIAFFFGGAAIVANDELRKESPTAEAPAVAPCPDGWIYTSVEGEEGDGLVSTCSKDPWVVVFNQDGTVNYGIDTSNPAARPVFDVESIPGWDP